MVYEVEAEFLAGFPVESEETARRAAVALQQLGPATVIITLGVQGALISTRTEQALIPAFKVTPVDSTAAGDIFCGSLAVALVESQSVKDSVRFASAAAAISVTRLGAQPSAPSREEIDRFLAQAV